MTFWREKSLSEMSADEWESVCDGCGLCCLNKLEDEETAEIQYTNIACKLLDGETCRCKDYGRRLEKVPDCLKLTAETVSDFHWLPKSCAYRLLDEGKPLPSWHPLVSGSDQSVHEAGMSVKGGTISEEGIESRDYENHLAHWPGIDWTNGD